jgi:Lysylphosphatidylglycerol synthase TM region
MSLSATDHAAKVPARALERGLFIALKVLVTGICFWYLLRTINFNDISRSIFLLELPWVVLSILTVMLQIPLVGMRWYEILHGLGALPSGHPEVQAAGCERASKDDAMAARLIRAAGRDAGRAPQGEASSEGIRDAAGKSSIIAIAAIGMFFGQVLPNVVGEGVRAWLLVRRGSDWRAAVSSVLIDRGVGVGLIIVVGFFIVLLAPATADLSSYRNVLLVLYGGVLLAGVVGLALLPVLLPVLVRLRYVRWIAQFADDARRVLLGSKGPLILGFACAIHVLTMCVIWSLGRAQGLVLPVSDVALLFVVMTGVAIVPASINGWGLREIAVVGLLARYGVAPEQALVLSVCFGLTLAIGSLPGAIAWLLYPAAPGRHTQPR